MSFITPPSLSRRKLACAWALLAGLCAGSAQATDNDSFFFRGGPAYANFDVKKIWLKTDATGFVQSPTGALPTSARIQRDPVIINGGLSFHF